MRIPTGMEIEMQEKFQILSYKLSLTYSIIFVNLMKTKPAVHALNQKTAKHMTGQPSVIAIDETLMSLTMEFFHRVSFRFMEYSMEGLTINSVPYILT